MNLTDKLDNLKKTEVAVKKLRKWFLKLFMFLVVILGLRGCISGCSAVMEEKKKESIAVDSTSENSINPTFPLKYPRGDFRCITEVAVSELNKFTKRDPNEQPLLEAIEYYIEGVILDQFRNTSVNDKVLDTLSWNRYKQDSLYRLTIWEQIITTE